MKTRRWLWHLVRQNVLGYLAVTVVAAGYQGTGVVTGLLLKAIFDTITGDAQAGFDVYTLLAFMAVLNLVSLVVFQNGFWNLNEFLKNLLHARLQSNLLHTVLSDRPQRLGPSSGEMLNRFRDDVTEAVEPIFLGTLFIGSAVSLGVGVYVMASIDSTITVVALVPSIAVFTITKVLGGRIDVFRQRSRQATGRVSGSLGELLGAVQVLQVAGAEERARNHFDQLSDRRRSADMKEGIVDGLMGALTGGVVTMMTGVVLLFAAGQMRNGSFTVGDFALFASIVGTESMNWALQRAGAFLAAVRRARVSFERLSELIPDSPMDALIQGGKMPLRGPIPEEPSIRKTPQHRLESLVLESLSYTHPASDQGINGISLSLLRGSFTVVTGRIGSGKTTLLEVLLGLLPMDTGEVRWNGKAVTDLRTFLVPPRCAHTPQTPWLFSDTLRSNILMGLKVDDEKVMEVAIHTGVMEQDVAELESGLETIVGPRGVKLSGGQVQRAAAARMFVRNPELLVFDDLSSALDVETEQALWERVLALPDVTMLVVSHRRAAFKNADNIIVLKEGGVEAEGKLNDLLQTCEEMQLLWQGNLGRR